MALITEDVQASETPDTAPPKTPARSNRAILGWAAVVLALAASAVLAVAVLRDDSTTSAPLWTGDVKDHPGYGPVDPATLPWTGDSQGSSGLRAGRSGDVAVDR